MRLREIRKQNGMTTKELAGILGVTQAAVSNWENGIRSPKVSDLCQIARVLGCTPNDLLGFETPEESRTEIIARRMAEAREGSEA